MRKIANAGLEMGRVKEGLWASTIRDWPNGAFTLSYKGARLRIISSNGEGWDHVSVSLKDRCPTWEEMCHVKSLFFSDDETVVQYHPKKEAYVNTHPYCLHLWRRQNWEHELPPEWMIGIKDLTLVEKGAQHV